MPRYKFDSRQPHLMNDTHYYTLKYLVDTARHHGKAYCFPSQATIAGAIARYGIEIGRRQVVNVLNDLAAAGLVERVRRHTKRANGELWLRSTLYKITGKAFGLVQRFVARIKGVWNFKTNRKKQAAAPPAPTSRPDIDFSKPLSLADVHALKAWESRGGPPSTVPV